MLLLCSVLKAAALTQINNSFFLSNIVYYCGAQLENVPMPVIAEKKRLILFLCGNMLTCALYIHVRVSIHPFASAHMLCLLVGPSERKCFRAL